MKKFNFLLPILTVLILWELVSRYNLITSSSLLPPPSKVLAALGELISSGILLTDLQASLGHLIAGLFLGVSLGITIGIFTGTNKSAARLISPLIQVTRSFPPVAIIPLVIVWLGIGETAKIFSIAWATFFPVWLNAHLGAQRVRKEFFWSAKLLGISNREIMFRVTLPSALPMIIAGIRNSIALGFIMVFVSELAGASNGLGYRIEASQQAYRTDQMIAALMVLGLLGAATDRLFAYSMHLAFPWVAQDNS